MKKLPIGISDFKSMIEEGYQYIDKTELIHHLITKQKPLYFLSRPRRFGKSLLVSTLKHLYSGNKALFKDTWIGKHSSYSWKQHPIIHLDFSALDNTTSEEFKWSISHALNKIGLSFEIDLKADRTPGSKLETLITTLSKKNKVAVLIDEYDSPLLAHISNPKKAPAIHRVMKDFFTVLKSQSENVHAVFVTGVTKFAKTSLFSGPNNLDDLTMLPETAQLLGYTGQEIETNFKPYLQDLAKKQGKSVKQTLDDVQSMYNGYRFSRAPELVYNPHSVIHCLSKKEFKNYWFTSGTPSFLVTLIKEHYEDIVLEGTPLSESALANFELDNIPLIPVLFQAGYLTIKDYDSKKLLYTIDFPNSEVKDSFVNYLCVALTRSNQQTVEYTNARLRKALDQNDMELFCLSLRNLFANIPYNLHVPTESYYHSIFLTIVTMLGLKEQSEVATSKGRIDMVIKTRKRIYIFEFKFEGTGKNALDQILKRRYYEKYQRPQQAITLVGIAFNIKKKDLLVDWVSKNMK
jgi:hypothetical protein